MSKTKITVELEDSELRCSRCHETAAKIVTSVERKWGPSAPGGALVVTGWSWPEGWQELTSFPGGFLLRAESPLVLCPNCGPKVATAIRSALREL